MPSPTIAAAVGIAARRPSSTSGKLFDTTVVNSDGNDDGYGNNEDDDEDESMSTGDEDDDDDEGPLSQATGNGRCIAESEETAVIFGMPREAIRAGAIEKALPLGKMAEEILAWCSRPADGEPAAQAKKE